MEGPSSKEANIYSDDAGSHGMSTFNHPAPPPPYQTNSSYPHPNPGPSPEVIHHPPVTVTEQQYPGTTENRQKYPEATGTQHNYPGATTTQQQYPGATVIQQPGVTITQQPGVTVVQAGVPVTTTAVVGNTVVQAVYMQPMLGSKPTLAQCRSCNYQMTTRVEYKSATKTHLFAVLLCVIGMWPCVCIPYCVDSCQAAQHYCSNCGAYIGTR